MSKSTNYNLDIKLITIFKNLQQIPSVPFLTSPIGAYIENYLNKHKITYLNTGYSIVVRPNPNKKVPKLVIMSHSDHPGIALKNNKNGTLFGTLYVDRLSRILKTRTIPLKIFSPTGKYQGKGKLISIKNNQAKIITNLSVKPNSSAQYDIQYFQDKKRTIKAYNTDNAISVATMLHLISANTTNSFDIHYVFNLYEEVHQISSWNLTKNNTLNISSSDLIVNLECAKTDSLDSDKYNSTEYKGGIVLQLSNTGCLFGYKSKKGNLSEKLLSNIARKRKIPLQIGVTKGSCDSRTFSYFNLTPNIVTLTIPNKYKHNKNECGDVVPEEILKKDISNFHKLTKNLMSSSPKTLQTKIFTEAESLSLKLKQKDDITDHQLMESKAILNERLSIAYRHIVKRKYFYPQNLIDQLADILFVSFSYLLWSGLKLKSLIFSK